MMWRIIILMMGSYCMASLSAEKPHIPAALKEWVPWVLHDHETLPCPIAATANQRRCLWVSKTALDANNSGLSFKISARAYASEWLDIPGSAEHWPVQVRMRSAGKAEPLPLRDEGGRPQVLLPEGEYDIAGTIPWSSVPRHISLPRNSGLIELRLKGQTITQPKIDRQGKLWLRDDTAQNDANVSRDTERLQVFRLLKDGNPFTLVTQVILDISGSPRELKAGQFLLDNFKPLSFSSPLPARIEKDKSLRVQVKPGRWVIEMEARHHGPVQSLSYEKNSPLWPGSEMWAFKADRNLRTVQLNGAPLIDPQQTNMPARWKQYPAYQLSPENKLEIQEVHRGDPSPEADELSLRRSLYLDFNGDGFTIEDIITGEINRSWRMDSAPKLQLGSVRLDGDLRLITQSLDSTSQGFEIRSRRIDAEAVSRFEGRGAMSVSGWLHDFNKVSAALHLPPGWALLATSGIDNLKHSWLSRWNLWDIFLVLLIVVAVFKLSGVSAGLLALATLLFIYHRHGAPLYAWLNLVAVIALLRVTEGKIQYYLRFYLAASFALLLIIFLPFASQQLKQAIYPQLELGSRISAGDRSHYSPNVEPAPMQEAMSEPMSERMQEEPEAAMDGGTGRHRDNVEEIVVTGMRKSKERSIRAKRKTGPIHSESIAPKPQADSFQDFDPNAIVQTGPGVPTWHWKRVNLIWNGPVAQGEEMRFWLVPPWLTRLGSILAVVLSMLFAYQLYLQSRLASFFGEFKAARTAPLSAILLLLVLPGAQDSSANVYVNSDILDTLEERLTEAPRCLPNCASINAINLVIDEKSLNLVMTVDAQDNIAFGLPAWRDTWLPASVTLDNKPAVLKFSERGQLLIKLTKGRHKVTISGNSSGETIDLNFGIPVHNATVSTSAWSVSGVSKGMVKSGSLQLQRLQKTTSVKDTLLPDPIPPFLQVKRQLNLGLEWTLSTTVRRLAPASGAISVAIPLLEGEAPISEVEIKDRNVLWTLGPNQSQVSWQSVMKKTDSLALVASEKPYFSETWSIRASPIWHLKFEGITPIKQANSWQHIPVWKPWPGEQLKVKVERPSAVEGQNITVDSAKLQHSLGQRSNNTSLTFQVSTSRGQNFPFTLPGGAELKSLSIDGRSQALVKTEGEIKIPLSPGEQTIVLNWKSDKGVSVLSSSPDISLGDKASNISMKISLPHDRWALFVGGPLLGPAILIWGILIVVAIGAFLLSRSAVTPLRFHHWLFLGLGLASTNLISPILMVVWLFALGWRAKLLSNAPRTRYHFIQVLIFLLSIAALASLLISVPMGLLSSPDMHIVGNNSSRYILHWYQDHATGSLPTAWVVSMPIYVYRIVMLAWSLWLAIVILDWLKWAWVKFSEGGIWKAKEAEAKADDQAKPSP